MKKIIFWSLINSIAVSVYIALVVFVMDNAEKIFGSEGDRSIFGPITFLMLFVTSAAITSSLVFGRPIWWYLKGDKKEALKLAIFTIGWLFVFTVLLLVINFLTR